jgi:hypothetical protein
VEVGTHDELLARQGEYAHLYQIQAQAFTSVRRLRRSVHTRTH